MIYQLKTSLKTPIELLRERRFKEEFPEPPVLPRMFDSYQDIGDDIPHNRVCPKVIYPETINLTGVTTPIILTDKIGNQTVYRCYITDPIGFKIEGKVYEDDGYEVDLETYLSGKKLKFSMFNLWGDLVASKETQADEIAFVATPAIFAGVYTGVLELIDNNNVVLTKLFGMDDATFAVESYIENTTLTDIYVNTLPIEVVDELPAEGVTGILYLLQSGSATDPYTEYLWVNNAWVKLGVIDYEDLENLPTINGVTVISDKTAPEYDLEYDMDSVSNSDIDSIVE